MDLLSLMKVQEQQVYFLGRYINGCTKPQRETQYKFVWKDRSKRHVFLPFKYILSISLVKLGTLLFFRQYTLFLILILLKRCNFSLYEKIFQDVSLIFFFFYVLWRLLKSILCLVRFLRSSMLWIPCLSYFSRRNSLGNSFYEPSLLVLLDLDQEQLSILFTDRLPCKYTVF